MYCFKVIFKIIFLSHDIWGIIIWIMIKNKPNCSPCWYRHVCTCRPYKIHTCCRTVAGCYFCHYHYCFRFVFFDSCNHVFYLTTLTLIINMCDIVSVHNFFRDNNIISYSIYHSFSPTPWNKLIKSWKSWCLTM